VGKKDHEMTDQPKSFEDLVNEAPLAPAAGTVSLIGTLARSSEAGKFVLTILGGSAVTLDTAAVKSHAVLGTSAGHTIVRVDVNAGMIPEGTLLKVPLEHVLKAPNEIGFKPPGETEPPPPRTGQV
jgi:hypothetical protein